MSQNSKRVVLAFRLWGLALLALHLLAPRFGEATAWGLWPFTYLPWPWRWGLALGAAVLILWGEYLWRRLAAPITRLLLRVPWEAAATRLALASLAAVPFWLFRIRHLRWGDAYILAKAIPHPEVKLTYVWQAPLDVYLHARLWQLANRWFGWPDPIPVYWILSTLAGVGFVWVLLGLAHWLGRDRTERVLIVGLILTLGTMQLFFGYIENYSIMTAGVLLYAWLALRALRGEVALVWPATALAITHAFHPSTIILAPSLVYLAFVATGATTNEAGRTPQLGAQPPHGTAVRGKPRRPIFRAVTHAAADTTADEKAYRTRAFRRFLPSRDQPAKASSPGRRAAIFRAVTHAAAGTTANENAHRTRAFRRFLLSRGQPAKASSPEPPGAIFRTTLNIAVPYAIVFVAVVALMTAGNHGLDALMGVDFPGGGDRKWFVPLFEVTTEWQHYTMFSWGHLVDIVNQQLMSGPAVWPGLIILAALAGRRISWRDPAFRLLAVMALFYLLLTLVWNADYGGQKDWDLFSPAAVPAALLLAYTLPRVLPDGDAQRKAAWALIVPQAVHTIAWIYQNTLPYPL